MSNYWKSVICVGSGNEGTSAGHTSGMLKEREEQRVELGVQQREPALNVQLWKSYVDEVDISVIGPSGVRVGPISERLGTQRFRIGGTEILLYYGKPSPYQTNQEIYFDFIPTGSYIDSGVWQIVLTPRKVVTGIYQMWLPSQSVLNQGTAFLNPVSSDTLTVPSTASRVVTVGASHHRIVIVHQVGARDVAQPQPCMRTLPRPALTQKQIAPAVIADYGSMHQQRGIRCGSKGIHQHEGIIQSELTPGIALCHQSGPTIRKIGVSLQ